jgi:CubicO group peptidase (beta-lactamase class C family)
VRLRLVATGLLVCAACSHAPPSTETKKVERRDDWLLALKSDLELTASNDGFQGQVRVVHGGKPEVDRTFGSTACLPLGAGRRLLATIAVGVLVDAGKLDWDDRLAQRLPSVANTSFAPLSLGNLLTSSAGLAHPNAGAPSDRAAGESELDWLVRDAGKDPLRAAPGTLVDPGDTRPWILVEAVVAQAGGAPFEQFVATKVTAPAGMTGTTLGATSSCPDAKGGTTTIDDQFRLIEALRAGKLVSAGTREALWEPRLPLGPGSEVGYGFFIRTRESEKAVGVRAAGPVSAYELWLDPAGSDALVIVGSSATKTAQGIRTTLGEFYSLPPGAPHATPTRKGVAR